MLSKSIIVYIVSVVSVVAGLVLGALISHQSIQPVILLVGAAFAILVTYLFLKKRGGA